MTLMLMSCNTMAMAINSFVRARARCLWKCAPRVACQLELDGAYATPWTNERRLWLGLHSTALPVGLLNVAEGAGCGIITATRSVDTTNSTAPVKHTQHAPLAC